MELKSLDGIFTFYAESDNKVVISCPFCKFSKMIDASHLPKVRKALSVSCPCGQKFNCVIEFRKFYRKQVNLPGEFIILKNKKKGDMVVKDISFGGIGFQNMSSHSLNDGEILELRFKLDNPIQSIILRKVEIKKVEGQFVGTEFTDKSYLGSDLGFYLLP